MNDALLRIIASVRRRWRTRLLLRGLAVVVTAGLAVFLLSAFGMDRLRFAPTAVLVFRVAVWGSLAVLAWWFLVRPLRRRVTDRQVALYLEEHEPFLDGQVMNAVEFAREVQPGAHPSPLVERVVERAVKRCHAIEDGRRVEHQGLVRSGGFLAGATVAALTIVLLNPGFVRNSGPFLLSPWAAGVSENPYAITVAPGDTLVARGADVRVDAALVNFTAAEVELVLRAVGGQTWERWTMSPDEESGGFALLLFDLTDSTEYFVESQGVRSAVHTLAVTDLPYVDRIALEYHFPAYTGLSPQRDEESGDIAALTGTRVRVEVVPTMPVAAGALTVDGDTLPLTPGPDGALRGEITVRHDGTYRVLLAAPDGRLVEGSPEYFIEALADQAPMITVARPGRDVSVTAIDEVFLEVEAEDDFGLRTVQLVISRNGGAEDTLSLYGGRGGRKALNAGHTLYLEEFDLTPGDVVSYYARAADARGDAGTSITDIYFVTIRPFDRTYRQTEQAGGGGGDGGMSAGELSERQRQIVAGTFNLLRDSASYSTQEFRDNVTTLTLAQGRLREDVETLIARIRSRGIVELDSTFAAVAEALPRAAEAMEAAEGRLGRRETREALPHEQRALQYLQRAEAAFRERELSRGQGGSSSNATGGNAEELADLFELELDKMRNQYEEVERGRQREADQQIDETLERLRELARRQQQENERARARAQRGDPSGATNGGQRRLAQQAEELARQLERLSRERSRPDLEEAARRLQEAADAMRRASAQGQAGGAQGNRALDRLQDAQRRLERTRSAGLRRDAEDALRRAERLAEQQRDVMQDADRLSRDPGQRREQLRRLVDRKEEMAREVDGLEAELDRLRREARSDEPEAARQLGEMARQLRDSRLRDKLLYSRGVVQQRDSAFIRNFEEGIQGDIDALREGIEAAVRAFGEQPEDRLEQALDETHDLAQALESLGERAREAGEAAEEQGESGLNPNARGQLRRELQERRQDLERLRNQLREGGVNVGPLDDMLRAMGRFDNDGAIGDPRTLDQLDAEIIQGLREFEYALRRQLVAGDDEQLFLSGSDEVPSEYREMVEEYYRRLAELRR